MRRHNNIITNFMHGRLRPKNTVEALHIAAFEGDIAAIEELVCKKKMPVDVELGSIMSSSIRGTPLFLAIDQENFDAARLLVSLGANIDARDRNDLTPLIRAASGDLNMVNLLIDLGADVNARRESDGANALSFSTQTDDVDKANSKEIETAYKIVTALILAGAEVEAPDHVSQSVLMLAARQDHYKVGELLLKHGANPERKCSLKWAPNWTALDHAINARSSNIEMILRKVTKTPTIATPGQG